MKPIWHIITLALLSRATCAGDYGDAAESEIAQSAGWRTLLTASNSQNSVSAPIDSGSVQFVVVQGQAVSTMNPWVVRRGNVDPQRLQGGVEISLQSDAAVDFLCQATNQTNNLPMHAPTGRTWCMAFVASSNRVVGFKVINDETFFYMPDAEKAIDNGGDLLVHTRPAFAAKFKTTKTANQTSQGMPRSARPP